ncbi:hypothetical protein [Mesorhizobium sp. CAU 1732]|uniref:HPr kinase/phosphorylase n=1 Tax=Mesorhizobium sp. CAU 1732 TaxID=3140358 RepID=UPI0032619539
MQSDARINVHATVLVVGRTGLLIQGTSGSGKSSLAARLIDSCAAKRVFSCLVADDRAWISVSAGRIVAEVPDAIAGLIETRGNGPTAVDHERRTLVDAVVNLVEPSRAPRHREPATEDILGVLLPRLDLPSGNPESCSRAVLGWLASDPESATPLRKW